MYVNRAFTPVANKKLDTFEVRYRNTKCFSCRINGLLVVNPPPQYTCMFCSPPKKTTYVVLPTVERCGAPIYCTTCVREASIRE